jgi:hypothetical protein
MATPFSSAASSKVWPLRMVHLLSGRTNWTTALASAGAPVGILLGEDGAPKLSCMIRSGFTPKPISMPRQASMNGAGPQIKNSCAC